MNQKTALLLSNSEFLSEELQTILFNTGYPAVLRNLSSNKFLTPSLKYRLLNDEKYITNMLSHPQVDEQLLRSMLGKCKTEHALMKFTSQPLLTSELISILATKATPMVGYYLALHPKTSDELKIKLFKRYVSILEPTSHYNPNELVEKFSPSPKFWREVLKTLGIEHATIASVSLKLVKTGELSPRHLVNYLKRIEKLYNKKTLSNPNWFRLTPYDKKIKELENLVNDLVSITTIHPNFLRSISKITFLTKAKAKALESLEQNYYQKIKYLEKVAYNQLFKSDKDKTVKILTELLGHRYDYYLPEQTVVLLTLEYYESLDEKTRTTSFDLIRGPSSRAIANQLYNNKEYYKLYLLVSNLSTLVLDDLELDQKTQIFLASQSVIDINNKEYIKKYAQTLTSYFAPLYLIASEPYLLSLIIKELANLPQPSRDTALALLPEWNQNLKDLIQASISLTNP